MSNLSDVILDEIDQITEAEFNATVEVCLSLFENYMKAFEMNVYAEQTGLHIPEQMSLFNDRFIEESSETFFRRKKEDGSMEHILISILKIPIRLLAALGKIIRAERSKSRVKTFELVMKDLKSHLEETRLKYKNVIGAKDPMFEKRTFDAERKVSMSNGKTGGKKESIKVSLDPFDAQNKVISSNIDLDEMISNQKKINKIVFDYNDSIDEIGDYKVAVKTAKRVLKSKSDISDSLNIKFNGNHKYTIDELIKIVVSINKTFDETEKICNDYKSTLEKLIDMIESNYDANEEKNKIDLGIINGLTGWQKDMTKIIDMTSNVIKCVDTFVYTCMDVKNRFKESHMSKPNG